MSVLTDARQKVCYALVEIGFADIATTAVEVPVLDLPQGATVVDIKLVVDTAFAGGTTHGAARSQKRVAGCDGSREASGGLGTTCTWSLLTKKPRFRAARSAESPSPTRSSYFFDESGLGTPV